MILTSVILLVLRRFNRLRFTLRMTSIRANSNSYKSSPGKGNVCPLLEFGSVHYYSNRPLSYVYTVVARVSLLI